MASSDAEPAATGISEKRTATREQFLRDVLNGLRSRPRTLPSKYLYDAEGSRLFERISGLDEYYLTRCETELMRRHVQEMVDVIGANSRLVEFGSGSSVKTEILLDHLVSPAAYVPVDISLSSLRSAVQRLQRRYPDLRITPLQVDYTVAFELPAGEESFARTVVYFPGSTIGNFQPDEAVAFLRRMRAIAGEGGGVLIGVDLQKDADVLEAAYNDREGVTARFNLNLLRRINRELGGDFDLSCFRHRAIYDERFHRIEMHLVSLVDQVVSVGKEFIAIEEGETICTEHSYKYQIEDFEALASAAGLSRARTWTDSMEWFSVHFLVPADGAAV